MERLRTINELGACRKIEEASPVKVNWLRQNAGRKLNINIAGLGNVGSNVLIGLALMGRCDIGTIGIYDLSEAQCLRWEMEGNQICEPFAEEKTPHIRILEKEELFDCDVFLFCVAKAVPEVGDRTVDVRMAQLEANAGIVSIYAKQSADSHFEGLFVVVSDPVDLLCRAAFKAAQTGKYPLNPYQIQGCGLGVMNARAVYYAKKDSEFAVFLNEGRVFGPHGKDLVVADSIYPENYDNERSLKLTELTVNTNMVVRELGFKPYVAPALSSAAYTVLRIIRGEWNYSANYLNGIYFGAKNRTTDEGIEWETVPLPEELYERLETSWKNLAEVEI